MPFDDDIAKKMGDLLLKGYCLLNSYCSDCSTALMRSRDGTDICVTCRSREVKESNLHSNNGNDMEEDPPTSSSSILDDIGEASSSLPNSRSRNTPGKGDKLEKFILPNDVWRNEKVPRMLSETIKSKLSWASSRLKIDSLGCLSLLDSCVSILTIMDADLSEAPEHMITMLNLEKFVESEQRRMSECNDIQECNKICDTIYMTLKIMKNLDQFNGSKLNPL